jgi:hypothetical protein
MHKFYSGNFIIRTLLENYKKAANNNLDCLNQKVYQDRSEMLHLIIILLSFIFKGHFRVTKDMVISSKFLPSLLLNRKFILHLKGKGRLRAKDQLIQFYRLKFTGAVME